MCLPTHVIAIDQGTTSTRAIAFDRACLPVAVAQREFPQIYPAPGLVEHDPEAIWTTTVETVRAVMEKAGIAAKDVAAIGIANQRETTLIWERATGKSGPGATISRHPAISATSAVASRE